jgi:hypothetical protein
LRFYIAAWLSGGFFQSHEISAENPPEDDFHPTPRAQQPHATERELPDERAAAREEERAEFSTEIQKEMVGSDHYFWRNLCSHKRSNHGYLWLSGH